MMDVQQTMETMARHAQAIAALVAGVSDEQAWMRPQADAWSIQEVVHHLLDEEREDFRVRLDYILHHQGEDWPPIDPQGWVTARDYNGKALGPTLEAFLEERERSLAWLATLRTADMETLCVTRFGQMRAGEMLAAWAAHDVLHLRQLVELQWALMVRAAEPYDPGYAGDW